MKAEVERSVFMGLVALFALAALYVAGRAGDGIPYWGGIGFCILCIAILFVTISRITRVAH